MGDARDRPTAAPVEVLRPASVRVTFGTPKVPIMLGGNRGTGSGDIKTVMLLAERRVPGATPEVTPTPNPGEVTPEVAKV